VGINVSNDRENGLIRVNIEEFIYMQILLKGKNEEKVLEGIWLL